MKPIQIFILFLSAVTQLVKAQNGTQDLPSCALDCMQLFVPRSSCTLTDQQCICSNIQLQDHLTACVKLKCSVRESLATQKIAAQTCDWPVHNEQLLLRKVTIPFFVIASLFFLTRITARMSFCGGEFGPDDYMISAAYLLTIGLTTVLLLLASAGLGKDIWQVPSSHSNDQVTYTLQLFTAFEKLYILCIWTTKMSILLLYLRIFPHSKFRLSVKFCLAFCAATAFCLFWACLFKCWPISYGWTFWDGEHQGSCSSQNAQGWANAALNIFGDLYVMVLPVPTIWRMSLSKGRRFGIIVMFAVGIFITIISLVRLYTMKVFNLSTNPTWDFVNISLWSAIEVNVGIMCACLPGTRNFYSRVICGKILKKGPFAPGASRAGSPTALRRNLSAQSQPSCQRSGSAASNVSDATTFGEHTDGSRKEVIYIINDIDIEEKSKQSMSEIRRWDLVEEWPVRTNH